MSCFRLDIANFLRNQGDRPLTGFRHEDGTEMPDAEVRAEFAIDLERGRKYLPMCDHDNFDQETGWCRGPKLGSQEVKP